MSKKKKSEPVEPTKEEKILAILRDGGSIHYIRRTTRAISSLNVRLENYEHRPTIVVNLKEISEIVDKHEWTVREWVSGKHHHKRMWLKGVELWT